MSDTDWKKKCQELENEMILIKGITIHNSPEMREANKNMAQFVIIIGEDEIKKGKATIKNMSDGTQTESDFNQIIKNFGVEYYNK